MVVLPVLAFSQDCSFTLKGHVKDADTGSPLEFVSLFVESTGTGAVTDSTGYFEMDHLCKGDYHIVLSHLSCESKNAFVHLVGDSTLELTMEHTANVLSSVVVTSKSDNKTTQNVESINQQSISDNANENLGNMLQSIAGVSTLKTGSGIAKPVVHGLYGNRLTILNNGITQSGQQWGNDHSPEIDPLVANKIRVIKGTSSLEYMGSNLGNVVIVEPKRIYRDPHLHGRAHYSLETNGRSHGLNVQLQKYNPKLSWKINGTLKKSGDQKTAHYFLTNTGDQEANLALQFEKSFADKWFADLFFSTYNTEIGVLRGSHIGNLTDLEEAFHREIPFYTKDSFSYQIDAPKQKVNHHLLKLHTRYLRDDAQQFNFTFAAQFDNRREYDVRRGGRSEIPALSIQQFAYFAEAKYQRDFKRQFRLKSGVQMNITDNTNNPNTGILPLIPDYLAYETGVYLIGSKKVNKSFLEIGVRSDRINQNVVAISRTLPREIVRYDNVFQKLGTSLGWRYSFTDDLLVSYNMGLATRNPAINELYSFGLHQGVSGIEEGNLHLEPEKSLKSTLGLNANIRAKLSLDVLGYYQRIKDYIYLDPQKEIRLTIRGAFPVFEYKQTDAEIFGLDFTGKYQINRSLKIKCSYSFIKGHDLSNHVPVINLPSNNILSSIGYEFFRPIAIGHKKLENFTVELIDQNVFEQKNILPEQDFVPPPKGYNLLNAKLATDMQLKKQRLRFTLKVNNILNESYRDYLNRQRYFADGLGTNFILGIGLKF